jgi:hypothetical protein
MGAAWATIATVVIRMMKFFGKSISPIEPQGSVQARASPLLEIVGRNVQLKDAR